MVEQIKVSVVPRPELFPKHGGVREHLIQLYHCAGAHPRIELVNETKAQVVHVESSYKDQHRQPDIYVCHGGFAPSPIPAVVMNLRNAKVIVSVSKWLVDEYFPQYAHKTVVIPNGVRLAEWSNVPSSGLKPGYILYAKEWVYEMTDFVRLAELMPRQHFVSTVWPEGMKQLANVEVIGVQSRDVIRSVLNDAACLMLPGSEVCPTMLLEAWACGRPVVAKNVHGSRELMLVHGGDDFDLCIGGMLYNDVNDVVGFLNEPYLSMKFGSLGESGRSEVEKHYQWADLFERYVSIYEAIIQDDYSRLGFVG